MVRGLRGPHAHALFVLHKSATFGRAAAADVQVLDQRVSRQHARLMLLPDGSTLLIDLSSANGTFVQGERIRRQRLLSGDRIQIGVAEYVYEERRGAFETSPMFRNKLSTRETFGATIVRRVASGILGAPTAQMHGADIDRAQGVATTPTRAMPVAQTPTREAAAVQSFAGADSVSQTPTREAPAVDGSVPGPRGIDEHTAIELLPRPSGPDGQPRAGLPFAPRSPTIEGTNDVPGFPTEPLDPRRHADRVAARARRRTLDDIPAQGGEPSLATPPTPPDTAPPPGRAPASSSAESAQQAVQAVLRLLAMKAKETDGARLRISERAGLRRIEGALRARRGSGNRRRWARLPCKLTARVGDRGSPAAVTDIGAGGISIENSSLTLAPGDEVTIRVQLGEGRVVRVAVFQTKVVWVDALDGTFGAVFAGPATWEMAG